MYGEVGFSSKRKYYFGRGYRDYIFYTGVSVVKSDRSFWTHTGSDFNDSFNPNLSVLFHVS